MANEVPTIQQTEKLETSLTPMNFGDAARQSAHASNIGSAIGADISLKAATARAELDGIEYGKNPQGDLLPSFTKADEAFNNAYRQQAKATIALQADQMMSNGLATLNQSNKLSPELIENFNNNAIASMDDLVGMAPKQDQEVLRNAIASQILQANEKLNNKLLDQQRADQLDTHNNYAAQTAINMFDAGANGNDAAAKSYYNDIVNSNNAAVEAGLISKTDATTANESAKINYYTAREYSKALTAINNKTLPQFLSDFGKNPPKDMSPSEYVQVTKGLLGLINLQESTESRNQSLIMSEANVALQLDQMTQPMLKELKETLDPENFNKVLATYEIKAEKRRQAIKDRQFIYNNLGDAGALSQVPDGQLNDAYQDMVSAILRDNPQMDPFAAKTFVASNTARAIPAYIKEVNGKATSGNADSMQQALTGLKSLGETYPAATDGITSNARNMMTMFEQGLDSNDPQTAAELAQKAVLSVDATERTKREENLKYIHKNLFESGDRDKSKPLIKGAKAVSGIDPTATRDPIGFAMMVKDTFDLNYLALGDENAAITRTKEKINKGYAQSYSNTIGKNKPLVERFPVEMALGASKQQIPIVNNMIADAAKPFVAKFNANSTVYQYNIINKNDVTSIEYLAAKKAEQEITFGFKSTDTNEEVAKNIERLRTARTTIKKFENFDRPMVERIDKVTGKKEEFFLGTTLQNDGSLLGKPVYDIKLINLDGRMENFLGMDNIGGAHFIADDNQFRFNLRFFQQALVEGNPAAVADSKERLQKEAIKRTEFVANKAKEAGLEPSPPPIADMPTADYPRTMRVATGQAVASGREIFQNPDGTVSTELSITVTDERLNEGKPTNIPSLWNGVELSEDESILMALKSGKKYESFKSIEAAVAAAEKKSAALGKEIESMGTNETIQRLLANAIKNGVTMNEIYDMAKKKGLSKAEVDEILGNLNE